MSEPRRGGTGWERVGNLLGTDVAPVVPSRPSPLKGEGLGNGAGPIESEADRYTVAMTIAATVWIAAHPEAYRRMVDGTMGQYRGQEGEFALRMAGLMRACADAAGFPCFRLWLERAA